MRDLDACLDLAGDRGWARESDKWRLLLELGGGYGVDEPRGGLAATVFLTQVAPGIGVVGMLLVVRRHGGRGLGRRLMEEALGAAGCATVFLYATEAGRRLYASLGFRVADELITHAGVFRRAGERPAAVAVRAAGAGDLPTLARLDQQAFGADRSAVLRHLPAFAERVAITAGGYAAVWRNLRVVHAGPLVADSMSTARALLEAVLPEATATVRVDLHAREAAALGGWLAERGLTARAPSPLMVRGRNLPWNLGMVLSPLMQALG